MDLINGKCVARKYELCLTFTKVCLISSHAVLGEEIINNTAKDLRKKLKYT